MNDLPPGAAEEFAGIWMLMAEKEPGTVTQALLRQIGGAIARGASAAKLTAIINALPEPERSEVIETLNQLVPTDDQ